MSSKAEGVDSVEEPRRSPIPRVHAGPSSTSFLRRISSPTDHTQSHYRISPSVSAARDLPYNLQRRVHFGYPPSAISDEQDLSRKQIRRQSVPVAISDQDTSDSLRRSSVPAGSTEQSPPQSAKRISVDMDHAVHSRPTPSPITVPALQSHLYPVKRSPVELPPLPEMLANRADHDREAPRHPLPSTSSLRRPPSESPTLNHRIVQPPKLPLLHNNLHFDPLVSRYTEAYLAQLRAVFEDLWHKHVQDVGKTMSSLYHEAIRAHDQKTEGHRADVLSVNHDLSMQYKDRQVELEHVKSEKEKLSQARIKEKEEFSELCRRLRSERDIAKNYSQKLKDERNGFFDDNLKLKKQVAKAQSEAEKMRKELQYLRSRLNTTAEVHIFDDLSRPPPPMLHNPWVGHPVDQQYYLSQNLSKPSSSKERSIEQRHPHDLPISKNSSRSPIRRNNSLTDHPLDQSPAAEVHLSLPSTSQRHSPIIDHAPDARISEHRSPILRHSPLTDHTVDQSNAPDVRTMSEHKSPVLRYIPLTDSPVDQRHAPDEHPLRSPITKDNSDHPIDQRRTLHVHTFEQPSRSPLTRESSLRDSPFERPPSRPSRPPSRPASRPISTDEDAMELSPIEEPKRYRSPTLSTPSPHSDKSVPSDKFNASNVPPSPSLAPVPDGHVTMRRDSASEATLSRSPPPPSPPPRMTSAGPVRPLSPIVLTSEPPYTGPRPPPLHVVPPMSLLNGLNHGHHHQAEIHRHRDIPHGLPSLSKPPLHLNSPLPSHTSLPSLSSNRMPRLPFSRTDRKNPLSPPFTHAPLSRSPPFPLPALDTKSLERPKAAAPSPVSTPHPPPVSGVQDDTKPRNGRKRNRSIFEASSDREPLRPATNATKPQPSSSSLPATGTPTPGVIKTISTPSAPVVKKPALGFQHQDLLYNDIVNDNKLVCKQCLDKKITPPTSFPSLSATWPQLKEHWMTDHPADYAILEKKSPSELIELLQRHRSSMGTSAKRQKV